MLTRQEIQDAVAVFSAALAAEHARKLDAIERRRARRGDRPSTQDEDQRRIELYELREAVRQKFYKENGYKRYVDSTGREVWLSPQEYDQRTRRRRRRRAAAPIDGPMASRTRTALLYGGLALLALVLGFALAR